MRISQESTGVRVFFNKVAGPQNCNFIKKTLTQVCSCEIEIFQNNLFYRTSTLAVFESFRFPACSSIKKETPAKMFFCEFYRIFENIFSFDRAPPDDWFLCFSVNFEKFFRILLLYSDLGKCLFHVQVVNH